MSEFKKTGLVLGAGGFIGSHMVKRLRKEGYWVRGVDLKYPEYADTEANEFIQGDLRDVDFVRRVIQFKGYQGNHFNEVPYRLIEPFDEIYQFAVSITRKGRNLLPPFITALILACWTRETLFCSSNIFCKTLRIFLSV